MQPRARRALAATLVLVAAGGLILWNASAQQGPETYGVGDAKRQAASLDGAHVTVRGVVVAGTVVYDGSIVSTFVVADDFEQLLVRYGQAPPDGFGAKDVVIDGTMQKASDGTLFLDAESIQVGCASKY